MISWAYVQSMYESTYEVIEFNIKDISEFSFLTISCDSGSFIIAFSRTSWPSAIIIFMASCILEFCNKAMTSGFVSCFMASWFLQVELVEDYVHDPPPPACPYFWHLFIPQRISPIILAQRIQEEQNINTKPKCNEKCCHPLPLFLPRHKMRTWILISRQSNIEIW
jgi:hypothetical protein